jgi:hypothetical protein
VIADSKTETAVHCAARWLSTAALLPPCYIPASHSFMARIGLPGSMPQLCTQVGIFGALLARPHRPAAYTPVSAVNIVKNSVRDDVMQRFLFNRGCALEVSTDLQRKFTWRYLFSSLGERNRDFEAVATVFFKDFAVLQDERIACKVWVACEDARRADSDPA